jgi:hypothetical protein
MFEIKKCMLKVYVKSVKRACVCVCVRVYVCRCM